MLGFIGNIFLPDCNKFLKIMCPTFFSSRDAPTTAMLFALKNMFASPMY